jgi:hypothetical protein
VRRHPQFHAIPSAAPPPPCPPHALSADVSDSSHALSADGDPSPPATADRHWSVGSVRWMVLLSVPSVELFGDMQIMHRTG